MVWIMWDHHWSLHITIWQKMALLSSSPVLIKTRADSNWPLLDWIWDFTDPTCTFRRNETSGCTEDKRSVVFIISILTCRGYKADCLSISNSHCWLRCRSFLCRFSSCTTVWSEVNSFRGTWGIIVLLWGSIILLLFYSRWHGWGKVKLWCGRERQMA